MDIFNGYRINNPDGILKEDFDEWQKPFANGINGNVDESSSSSQQETSESDEIYDPDKKRSDNNSADNDNSSQGGSNTDGHSPATARPLSALSVTSPTGGGLGTLASVIASTLATAALVVAVFVSVLTIRLSLVMADVDKLVVQVTMEGAQEEDFLTPIVAVLEGRNGEHIEQSILPDTCYLTFDGLAPNEEYIIRVQSGEKLFAENSFVTAAIRKDRGSITAFAEGNNISVTANDVVLETDGFYSVVAKDDQGKTVFCVDSDESNKTFTFSVDYQTDLYITLGIGGEVYSVCRIKTESGPVYDFENGTWEWTDNYNATVSFGEIHGGAPLKIAANVVGKTTLQPGCETLGEITYTATAEYGNAVYSDVRTETISALGHEYGEPTFVWTATDGGYSVSVESVCRHDGSHKKEVAAGVTAEVTDPTCEKDGYVTYTATAVFESKQYTDKKVVINEKSALGHDYGEPTFTWTETADGYSATAEFVCGHDGSHKSTVAAAVAAEATDPTCEKDGYVTYTATVTFENKQYTDKKAVENKGTALGHEYGEPTFIWTETSDGYSVTAEFTCIHDGHSETVDAAVTYSETTATCEEDGTAAYTAVASINGVSYSDVKTEAIPAFGHEYGEPTFIWTGTADGYVSTAKFVCIHDGSHVENVKAEVAVDVTEPTCEEDGYTTYTATAIMGDEIYSDEKTVIFEESAIGHDFSQYNEDSDLQPEFIWTADANGVYTAKAVFHCNNDYSHTVEVDAEMGVEDGTSCTEVGYVYYYAYVTFNDCDYNDEKAVEVQPGHDLVPVFHWSINGDGYIVEFYMVCTREDYHDGPISAELSTTEGEDYTLYTATAIYDDVEYTEYKKVMKTDKPLELGSVYRVGDTIVMSGNVYFSDDYAEAKRTSMVGPTPIVSVGSDDATQTSYDAVILQNDQFVRVDDSGWAAGEMPEWLFTSSSGELIGVCISDGSGTAEDPYVLTPVYGVKVTFEANDGVFNIADGYSVTQYYTEQEVSDGVYAVPIAENPEASGRLFIGWFTDEYATEKFDFENTPITESITLYAGWIAV